MPLKITQDCILCGACADVCPNDGIQRGNSAYMISQAQCTECVGFFNRAQCAEICPIDCCVPNPKIILTEEALFERAKAIHVNTGKHPILSPQTSHFRVGSTAKCSAKGQSEQGATWWERLFGKKLAAPPSSVPSQGNS